MANKKFFVKLRGEERKRLSELISKGKASAKTTLKARILLKADQGETGEGWSDEEIRCALGLEAVRTYQVHLVSRGRPKRHSTKSSPRCAFSLASCARSA